MQKVFGHQNDEVNLLDYWRVVKRRKIMIGAIVGVMTIATIIASLVMPKYYMAQAMIMPVGKGGGGGLAMIGGLASLAGFGGVGVQTPSQQFMALLKTRTLAEEIINKYDLMGVMFKIPNYKSQITNNAQITNSNIQTENELRTTYDARRKKGPTVESAVNALLGCVSFMDDKKNGTIMISAEFNDPKLAAEVANGYVEGLQKFINDNSFTVAKRNRIFIEGQLAQNKRELLEAGKELNEFYKAGKVSSVESRVDVSIEIASKASNVEGQQNVNPKQIQSSNLQKGLDELQKQKEEVGAALGKEVGSGKQEAGSDPSPLPSPQRGEGIVRGVPQQVYLQYLTLRRNLLSQINTLLTQQYEMAKIDEAKDELAFQVIDPARVPETRSKPKRRQMVMMAFVASLFIGVFAAFFLEYVEKMRGGQQGGI